MYILCTAALLCSKTRQLKFRKAVFYFTTCCHFKNNSKYLEWLNFPFKKTPSIHCNSLVRTTIWLVMPLTMFVFSFIVKSRLPTTDLSKFLWHIFLFPEFCQWTVGPKSSRNIFFLIHRFVWVVQHTYIIAHYNPSARITI